MRIDLIKGDCLEKMKGIEDKSINLILIDPPYNISKAEWDRWKTVEDYVDFMGKVFLEIQRVLKDNGSFYFFHNDFLQIVELQSFINKNTDFVFKQFLVWNKRFNEARNKGFLDGFCEVENLRNYQQMAEYCLFYTFQDETGLKKVKTDLSNFKTLRDYSRNLQHYIGLKIGTINKLLEHRRSEHFFYHSSTQWDLCTQEVYNELVEKFSLDKWTGFRKYEDLRMEYEDLRMEYEDLRYTYNNLKQHHSVMNYEIAKKQGHITPKNTDMLEYLIKTSSNEGGSVLDCFMGSCSTGVACLNTNRNFIGIELDDNYFDIASNRINKYIEENNLENVELNMHTKNN